MSAKLFEKEFNRERRRNFNTLKKKSLTEFSKISCVGKIITSSANFGPLGFFIIYYFNYEKGWEFI